MGNVQPRPDMVTIVDDSNLPDRWPVNVHLMLRFRAQIAFWSTHYHLVGMKCFCKWRRFAADHNARTRERLYEAMFHTRAAVAMQDTMERLEAEHRS